MIPFWLMQILEDEDTDAEQKRCHLEQRLQDLRDEYDTLDSELLNLSLNEPDSEQGDAHERWDARLELLEDQMHDIEDAIDETEELLADL